MDTGHLPFDRRSQMADDDLTVLRLIRSRRVGPATYHRLVAEHGSARAALVALPDIAAAAGIASYEACPEGVAAAELAAGRKAGARLIRRRDDEIGWDVLADTEGNEFCVFTRHDI